MKSSGDFYRKRVAQSELVRVYGDLHDVRHNQETVAMQDVILAATAQIAAFEAEIERLCDVSEAQNRHLLRYAICHAPARKQSPKSRRAALVAADVSVAD